MSLERDERESLGVLIEKFLAQTLNEKEALELRRLLEDEEAQQIYVEKIDIQAHLEFAISTPVTAANAVDSTPSQSSLGWAMTAAAISSLTFFVI